MSNNNYVGKSESIKLEMLSYMEEKYGTGFTAISLDTKGADNTFDRLVCYADGTDPDTDSVIVTRHTTENGTVFHDSYFGILVRSEYESSILSDCSSLGSDIRVYVEYLDMTFDDSLGAGATLNDAISIGQSLYSHVNIFIRSTPGADTSGTKAVLEALVAKWPNTGYFAYFVSDSVFDSLTRTNHSSILEDYVTADGENCFAVVYA